MSNEKDIRPTQAEAPAAPAEESIELTAEQKKEAIAEHVKALRKVILISVGAVLVLFVVLLYGFCEPLVNFILQPVFQRGITTVSTAVSDALAMKFKVCLVAAITCGMPVIIWQVWTFVEPALYDNEKKAVTAIFFCSLALFIIGVVFCYIVMFPLTVDLFWEAADGVAESLWNVKDYFNFVLSFVLPFGLMFELPVVMYLLGRHGKVDYKKASKARKFVILGIAVVAAVLTPPDVISQMMLMLPMILLYEISVQLVRIVKPKEKEA